MNNKTVFDVVVVGAGPAGATAARYAAAGGCSVALFERNERVSDPVRCGEGIGLKALCSVVDEINPRWIQTNISALQMVSPSQITVDIADIDKGVILNRAIMDNDLVQKAVKEGVSFFHSTPVVSVQYDGNRTYSCTTKNDCFTAHCVVLADGIESRLARDLGFKTAVALDDVMSCAFCRIDHESIQENRVVFYFGSQVAPGGYAWVMPRAKGTANVGVGILGSRSAGGKAHELLYALIERRFPGAKIDKLHCGGVPVAKWVNPLVRDGALLVGDAARQVNSLNGGGLLYSLFAGRVAGECIAHAYSSNGFDYALLKRYQQSWNAKYGKQQLRSYSLKTALLKTNDAFYDSLARAVSSGGKKRINVFRIFFLAFMRNPRLLFKAFMLFR